MAYITTITTVVSGRSNDKAVYHGHDDQDVIHCDGGKAKAKSVTGTVPCRALVVELYIVLGAY